MIDRAAPIPAHRPPLRLLALTALVSLFATFGAACSAPSAPRTLQPDERAPADIAQACRLADYRCSRCHPIERILHAQVASFEQWGAVVHRMRLQQGSAISEGDEPAIVRCLTYVTLGPDALAGGLKRAEQRRAP